nr:immunoglobulin light chain junction region [Macaca mulatta]
CQKGDVIGTF